MKNLKPPIEDWVMPDLSAGTCDSGIEGEDYLDVCLNCRVVGSCDDRDIRCGLVAMHNRTSDGVPATARRTSRRYIKALLEHVRETGKTPYPEQMDLIAKG